MQFCSCLNKFWLKQLCKIGPKGERLDWKEESVGIAVTVNIGGINEKICKHEGKNSPSLLIRFVRDFFTIASTHLHLQLQVNFWMVLNGPKLYATVTLCELGAG